MNDGRYRYKTVQHPSLAMGAVYLFVRYTRPPDKTLIITILPFILDNDIPLNDSFSYYIARMQWNYGYPDPLKDRVNEFLDKVCEGL